MPGVHSGFPGSGGGYNDEDSVLRRENRSLKEIVKSLKRAIKKILESNKRLRGMVRRATEKITYWKNVVRKLNQPPNDYAIFVRTHPNGKPDEADVLLRGSLMKVVLSPELKIEAKDLKCGWEVLINVSGNVVEVTKDYWHWGESAIFREQLSEDLALVVNEHGNVSQCYISPELKDVKIKEGDLLLNCGGLLVKVLPKTEEKEHFKDVEEISGFTWDKIGGLSKAVKQIDRVLLTFKEAKVYKEKFQGTNLDVGMILHGPPGCGKTLVAKCIAADLGRYRGVKCYFMPLVGAELSNKYVGETSRKIREVFERAKERAGEDAMVLIFIDEMDSLFRSRSASGMEHEPWQAEHIGQVCSILDGMDKLGNIFIIGASNHKHLIDGAILRPGRLGKDVRIPRPQTYDALAEILKIYLTPKLPFAKKYFEKDTYEYVDAYGDGESKTVELNKDPEKIAEHFIDVVVKRLLWTGKEMRIEDEDGTFMKISNEFTIFSEKGKEKKFLKDFLSGAAVASIVETAKELALSRYIKAKSRGEEVEPDIKKQDFFRAVDEELRRLKFTFKQPEKENPIGFLFDRK